MATIRMSYTVQSCPKCNKQLLKVSTGTTIIGSPLLTCKKCGTTYRTNLRQEWYNYPNKNLLWILPLALAAVFLVMGLFMGEDGAVGVAAAILGLLFGLCFTIKDLIRMVISKKRMRNASYLKELLRYGVISEDQYERFMRDAA